MASENVFMSWDGPLSRKIAGIFREYVPKIVPGANPYVPLETKKGKQWLNETSKRMAGSACALVFLTKDTAENPRIHFEAGSIYKGSRDNKIFPVLINVRPGNLKMPLSLFRATALNEQEVLTLCREINKSLGRKAIKDDKVKSNWQDNSKKFLKEIKAVLKKRKSGKTGKAGGNPLPPQTVEHGAEIPARIEKVPDTGLQAAKAAAAASVPSPAQAVAPVHPPTTIQSIFPGIWSNAYSHVGGESGSEEFQIVDGTKCMVEGKHKFNITGFRYDPVSGTATFTKEWVGVAKAPIVNTVKRITRGHYEGSENDGAHVVYKRMR
jgi:hypothetical protein